MQLKHVNRWRFAFIAWVGLLLSAAGQSNAPVGVDAQSSGPAAVVAHAPNGAPEGINNSKRDVVSVREKGSSARFKLPPHRRPTGQKLVRIHRLAFALSLVPSIALVAFLIGWWRRYGEELFPARGILLMAAFWAVPAALNAVFIRQGLDTGVPIRFPISEAFFSWMRGGWYGAAFLLVMILALFGHRRLGVFGALAAGVALIVLGNLVQGSFANAFLDPFLRNGRQYCQDALGVGRSLDFLGGFHDIQGSLSVHARTHPPFAVLVHRWLIDLGGGGPLVMALVFAGVASASVYLVWHVFREAGAPPEKASLFSLLFAVLPAVNIYAIASLDGVIASGSLLALLGLTRLLRRNADIAGFVMFLTGFVLVNALTFGGTFLAATAGLTALADVVLRRRWTVLAALAGTSVVVAGLWLAGRAWFGYDHLRAFLTASAFENPAGFRGFHEPLKYLMTRAECVMEIAFFASVPVAAMLLRPAFLRIPATAEERPVTRLSVIGVGVLGLMFATGAFRTGETARTCLFIYPFLLLLLRHVPTPSLGAAVAVAGVQTVVMQLAGDYFW